LETPTLVIHGVNDPFIPIAHSEKLATMIPNAMSKWFENMGHDIPSELMDALITELISNFARNPG
jgi:pimeloyl-ACP methyl ester carboxylesterase